VFYNDNKQSARIDLFKDRLIYCGLDMENSCFSNGQLCVAFSRAGRHNHLYVYTQQNKTLNVVYQEVLI
jgi:hypothetical protein